MLETDRIKSLLMCLEPGRAAQVFMHAPYSDLCCYAQALGVDRRGYSRRGLAIACAKAHAKKYADVQRWRELITIAK